MSQIVYRAAGVLTCCAALLGLAPPAGATPSAEIPVFLALEVLATPGREDRAGGGAELRAVLASLAGAGTRQVRVLEQFLLAGPLLGYVAGEDPVAELRRRALRAGARYVALVSLTRLAGRESYDVQLFTVGRGPRLARASARDASEAGALARRELLELERRQAGALAQQAAGPEPESESELAPAEEAIPMPGASLEVVEIRVEGNRRIDADAIRSAIATRVGSQLDGPTVSEDIRRVYELGFFRNVEILASDVRGGKLVTIRVFENPVIRRVTITGNESMGSDDITEQLTITIGSTVDFPLLLENQARIRSMYQAQGYYLASVSYSLEQIGPEAVSIDFDVIEGRKLKLRKILFEGNEHLSDDELLDGFTTKPWGWASPLSHYWDNSGLYAEPVFYQDLDGVSRTYMDAGFIRVQVSEPQVEVDPEGLKVRVEIEEGPRYKVGLVDVLGDDTLDTADLLEAIELTPGSTFSRTTLSDDVERLRKRYADRGFYAARVRPRTDVDPDELTVDVIFEVEKNDLFFIDWIRVAGNTRTRDGVVRRELSLAEGDLYSDTALDRSRARVRRLGHFEEVSVETQQIDDQSVGVTIDVVERPTGSFSFGAGFGSTDGFLLNGSVRQDNLWGRGYSVAVSADLGTFSQFGTLRFSDPYFLDSVTAFSASLSYSSRSFDSFDQEFLGFGLDLSYPLDEGETRVGTGYAFTSREVSGFSSFQASSMLQREEFQEDTTTSLLSFSARRDKRDDFRFPKKGHVTGGAVELAGLGGVSKYVRFEGRTTSFWPRRLFGMDTTLVVNSRMGYAIPLNDISDFDLPDCGSDRILDCDLTNAEVQELVNIDSDLELPLTERYFLGGIGPFQVRGFEQRTVGARRSVLGPLSTGSYVFTASGRNTSGVCVDAGNIPIPDSECNSLSDTDTDDFANLDLTDIIGGNKMFLLNLELQFPISEELGLMGIVFFDTGNAFAENESLDPTELRFGTGFGAQWFSPFGPILVFVGFPLDKLEDEESSVFEFSLGGQQF